MPTATFQRNELAIFEQKQNLSRILSPTGRCRDAYYLKCLEAHASTAAFFEAILAFGRSAIFEAPELLLHKVGARSGNIEILLHRVGAHSGNIEILLPKVGAHCGNIELLLVGGGAKISQSGRPRAPRGAQPGNRQNSLIFQCKNNRFRGLDGICN